MFFWDDTEAIKRIVNDRQNGCVALVECISSLHDSLPNIKESTEEIYWHFVRAGFPDRLAKNMTEIVMYAGGQR